MILAKYISQGWRHLVTDIRYSVINVLGLSVGIASCLLILFFVRDELSFDNFWEKSDSIYRLHTQYNFQGSEPTNSVHSAGQVVHALKRNTPQISAASRLRVLSPTIKIKDALFVDGISFVDSDIENIFNFVVLEGNLKQTLQDNSSIALSANKAQHYFGSASAINKILTITLYGVERDYKVTAVYADLPGNTQVKLDSMITIDENDWRDQPWMFNSWMANGLQSYFVMSSDMSVQDFNKTLPGFIDSNYPNDELSDIKISDSVTLSAMNIQKLHMYAGDDEEYLPRGNIAAVWAFSVIAILVLAIASVNSLNLRTARATLREREVAIRKVVGASRTELMIQFLIEATILTVFALIISIAMVELILPTYNQILGKTYVLEYFSLEILQIACLALSVGLASSVYPAFILASYHPANIMRSKASSSLNPASKLRSFLITIQYTASIGLITATGVVYLQMEYVGNKDLGFTSQNLLNLNGIWREGAQEMQDVLVQELGKKPNVVSMTRASAMPPYDSGNRSATFRTETMDMSNGLSIGQRQIGYDFFKTLEIPIIAGRAYAQNRDHNFATSNNENTRPIIVNVGALRRLGIEKSPDQAIGTIIFRVAGRNGKTYNDPYQIVGIIADTNLGSLYSAIRPEVYFLSNNIRALNLITFRFTGDENTFIAEVKSRWENLLPDIPFSYSFVDEALKKQYISQGKQGVMLAAFSLLAIFIASIGLFGLASFTAERRIREIGIRKVMGADVFDIVKMLIWQFSIPVIIATLFALPISWYFMNDWLSQFAYHLDKNIIFISCLAAGLATLFVAWGTISTKAIKVARTNPISALRYE